ncbi:MAG: rhomboid family intramembrane serine protease [Verrucomicrobia bacterium]|nr:rhomboid family intramembrane serine protease [Verrucomicrobiota bacterium]
MENWTDPLLMNSSLIPTKGEQQAMEWSLVLVSQGIETLIAPPQQDRPWGLEVPQEDLGRALRVLRQYKIENRTWPWQQRMPGHQILFDWGVLGWTAIAALFFWLSSDVPALKDAGIMSNQGFIHGDWWRAFTAEWMHADLAHLGANLVTGTLLLGLAMGLYGTGPGLLLSLLAGAAGNLLGLFHLPGLRLSLGASGLVMGALGLLAAHSFAPIPTSTHTEPGHFTRKSLLSGFAAGCFLFILLGLSPGTDVLAHFGGFVSGLVLGILAGRFPALGQNPLANLACGLGFVLLVTLPWLGAFLHLPMARRW